MNGQRYQPEGGRALEWFRDGPMVKGNARYIFEGKTPERRNTLGGRDVGKAKVFVVSGTAVDEFCERGEMHGG